MLSRLRSKVFSQTPNAKIFRAGIIVSIMGLVTTAATAIKELTIARYFGRNDAIDAFFIAYLLPSFAVSLAVGSLGAALVPVFVEVRKNRGDASAQKLFSSVLFLNILVLSSITIILGLFSPYYLRFLGSGFSSEKITITGKLLLGLLPFIVFNGTALCITSVLNAGERFALPAIVPAITPLCVILSIVLAWQHWGAFAIVGGTLSGSIVEATVLAGALKKHSLRFSPKWYGLGPDVRSVLKQYIPMIAGSFLIGSTTVVDKSMAAMLPGGSVAALSYANKVVSGITVVGATALSTASFPYFSRMAAEKDWSGCRHTLRRYTILVMGVMAPFVLFLIAFSKPMVRILFQRGAFTAADTELVSRVQICYLIQVPFYLCSMLFVRFLSAARRNEVLMYGAGISLVLDVILNFLFMAYWGVAGIALSTSVVYICSLVYLLACSTKLLRESQNRPDTCNITASTSLDK